MIYKICYIFKDLVPIRPQYNDSKKGVDVYSIALGLTLICIRQWPS